MELKIVAKKIGVVFVKKNVSRNAKQSDILVRALMTGVDCLSNLISRVLLCCHESLYAIETNI